MLVHNRDARIEGMVRVVNSKTTYRALIKGLTGEVLDLQFAHLKSTVLLGCLEDSALHIHTIETVGDKMFCHLLLKIEDPSAISVATSNKINWCPYVPENELEIDEYASQELVWIRGNAYHCYSVNSIVQMYEVIRNAALKLFRAMKNLCSMFIFCL